MILIATEPAIIAHCAQNVSFATNNEKGPGRTKRSGKAGRGAGNALRPPHYGPFFPIFPILSNLERTGKDGKGWSRLERKGQRLFVEREDELEAAAAGVANGDGAAVEEDGIAHDGEAQARAAAVAGAAFGNTVEPLEQAG